MSKRVVIILALVVSTLMFQCGGGTLSEEELRQYPLDPKNGLLQNLSEGRIKTQIQYQPKDLILAQHIQEENWSVVERDSIERTLIDLDYFILKISLDDNEVTNGLAGDQLLFTKAQNYLSFEIGNNCRIIHSKDTFQVEDFIQTKTYGMAKATTIILAYRSALSKKSGHFTFLYEDTFFGTGLNSASFKTDNLKSIPHLRY